MKIAFLRKGRAILEFTWAAAHANVISETMLMSKGRFLVRLIKNLVFIIIGICILIYSYFLLSHKGFSLLPTSWGFLQGHKDLGVIVPLLIGILFIAQAIYELNSIFRGKTVNKTFDED